MIVCGRLQKKRKVKRRKEENIVIDLNYGEEAAALVLRCHLNSERTNSSAVRSFSFVRFHFLNELFVQSAMSAEQ